MKSMDKNISKNNKLTPQEKALRFFANPPKSFRIKIKGKDAAALIRKDRDD